MGLLHYCRGVYLPNGNDANFPSPPFPFPLLFPSHPLPPLPGGLGAEPPVAGVRGVTPENGNWNRIWCILAHFWLKTAAIQCFTFCEQKLNEFSPLQGVILFPWAQFGRKLRPLPPVDAPALLHFWTGGCEWCTECQRHSSRKKTTTRIYQKWECDIASYVTKLHQMSEYTNDPDYKLVTDKLQLVLSNVIIRSIFKH